MDIAAFCRQSRVLVVAGKGGVGKTTITAALARMAAGAGLDVLVVELEGKPGVATAFGNTGTLGYDAASLSAHPAGPDAGVGIDGHSEPGLLGTVQARRITPDDALLEYLADHGMGRISKRLVSSGALDVVATAIPGIRDILVLGKIKQLEREADADLILVDAPATGHAMTFLSSAQGLLDAARSGPVRAQAADVVELLTDPDRCQVALVTLPEEMPVNEVIEAAYQLEDKVGLTLGPVIVNACLPDEPWLADDPTMAAAAVGVTLTEDQVRALAAAAAFRASRFGLQKQQRQRLAHELPLHQLVAPFVFNDTIGPSEIDLIARALGRAVENFWAAEDRADDARTADDSGPVDGKPVDGVTVEDGSAEPPPAEVKGLNGSVVTFPAGPPVIAELVEERSIVVCCGSGGVGKTTISAAFALEAARRGRRACVVTIDPARRLADALGLTTLTNAALQIEGPWPGELWALMLDSKGTFDDLVRRYAGSEEQAEGILTNRIYRNLSGALSGTQEYMAMEKLYELAHDGGFDLIVVDTPPTRNALDFLDAPRRLTRFLGHRLFQMLLMPTRAYLRAVSVATQALLRTISKVAGAEIVHDAVAFFQAFEGMEEGFRHRADDMRRLLGRTTTAFVLVTSPRGDTVEEAGWFADRLNESELAVEGLVVNRVHPSFGRVDDFPVVPPDSALAGLIDNLRNYQAVNQREESACAALVAQVAPSPVAHVPLLDVDVTDVAGLALVADHVFAG